MSQENVRFIFIEKGQIDIGSSIVAVVSFGIIIDDTIHFLSKYQKAIRQGSSAEEAVCYAFSTVGRALLFTSIALFIGFSTLTLSSFTLNSSMGLLTAITIIYALYFDFLLLPLLLIWADKITKRRETVIEPITIKLDSFET